MQEPEGKHGGDRQSIWSIPKSEQATYFSLFSIFLFLHLDICWQRCALRWWDPPTGHYLLTFDGKDEATVRELKPNSSAAKKPEGLTPRAD